MLAEYLNQMEKLFPIFFQWENVFPHDNYQVNATCLQIANKLKIIAKQKPGRAKQTNNGYRLQ